jgi:hypothetical protein
VWPLLLRAAIVAAVVVAVTVLADKQPRWGAFLLTLPLTSILAFALTWQRHHDPAKLQSMARDTLVLVPLGLPFFVPLAFADRLGLSAPQALAAGLALASVTVGAWLKWGPGL